MWESGYGEKAAISLRQRINTVIDWAVAKGYRESGLALPVIDKALPQQQAKPKHHAALPYAELPVFTHKLRETESMGRLALEAVILTAARSGEVRLMTWGELDLAAATWTIPAERMKAHRRDYTDLVFPGQKRGKPLSDMTLTKALRDRGVGVTAHCFRSAFRDWVAEETNWPSDLAEAALAHVVSDETVAAYQRGTMLEKRHELEMLELVPPSLTVWRLS